MLPLDVDLRSGLLDKEASELADCAHSIASLKNRIRVGERSVRRYAGLMVKYRGHAGMVGCVLAALGGTRRSCWCTRRISNTNSR